MTSEISRRKFITQAAKGAAAASVAGSFAKLTGAERSGQTAQAGQGAAAPPVPSRVVIEPFEFSGVRLLDGRLKSQYDAMRDYYFTIPNDDILKGFRSRAGLSAPGNDLGGWYSGEPRRTWWSRGDTFNTFGQWLSAMARMSKATGDTEMRNKAIYLMTEWARAIEPDGYFFYSRAPWQPHYIYEKTVCGLVDMALYLDRKDALAHLEKITAWAASDLDRSRTPDSNTEWYTLGENLYRAYMLTGNKKFRDFGDVWRFTDYWNSFVGPSSLTSFGHHAYSHVNTLSSAAMAYQVSGDAEYLRKIKAAYDWLQETQCFATGGYGPDEELVPPGGDLGKRLETTRNSFETPCGSWAAFKLARYLIMFTGESRYGDWIEKLVYSGLGSALPMAGRGDTFYYSDYRLGGGRKIYYEDARWPCCSGTYPQAVTDYHNLIYFRDAAGLYVNLFVPSRVEWNQKGILVVVEQETGYPEADTVVLTVRPGKSAQFDLKFRVPAWAVGVTARVNGSPVEAAATPGSWAVIRRTWKPGDRVEIKIPLEFRLAPVDKEHVKRVAITRGPVVLVRREDPVIVPPPGGDLAGWLRPVDGKTPEYRVEGQPHGAFVPFYSLGLNEPYNMYFDY
jgi:uncharacterized protein